MMDVGLARRETHAGVEARSQSSLGGEEAKGSIAVKGGFRRRVSLPTVPRVEAPGLILCFNRGAAEIRRSTPS